MAEHGIGSIKLLELEHYRPRAELDLVPAIERAIDPEGLMDPGKVVRVDLDEAVFGGVPIR